MCSTFVSTARHLGRRWLAALHLHLRVQRLGFTIAKEVHADPLIDALLVDPPVDGTVTNADELQAFWVATGGRIDLSRTRGTSFPLIEDQLGFAVTATDRQVPVVLQDLEETGSLAIVEAVHQRLVGLLAQATAERDPIPWLTKRQVKALALEEIIAVGPSLQLAGLPGSITSFVVDEADAVYVFPPWAATVVIHGAPVMSARRVYEWQHQISARLACSIAITNPLSVERLEAVKG